MMRGHKGGILSWFHFSNSSFSLVSSAGVATSKLVGSMASSVVRTPGLAQVMAEQEASFLRPFPLRKILFRERDLCERLAEMGITRVSDLQALALPDLAAAFGRDGYHLNLLAHGIDFSPVSPAESFPELEAGESLAEATNNIDLVRLIMWRLSEKIGRKLREKKMSVCLLRLLVVYRDGEGADRRASFKRPTALDREIHQAALRLLDSVLTRRVQVIFLGLRASRLVSGFQPDLFGEVDGKTRLYQALDNIRGRYGDRSIHLGFELCPA